MALFRHDGAHGRIHRRVRQRVQHLRRPLQGKGYGTSAFHAPASLLDHRVQDAGRLRYERPVHRHHMDPLHRAVHRGRRQGNGDRFPDPSGIHPAPVRHRPDLPARVARGAGGEPGEEQEHRDGHRDAGVSGSLLRCLFQTQFVPHVRGAEHRYGRFGHEVVGLSHVQARTGSHG